MSRCLSCILLPRHSACRRPCPAGGGAHPPLQALAPRKDALASACAGPEVWVMPACLRAVGLHQLVPGGGRGCLQKSGRHAPTKESNFGFSPTTAPLLPPAWPDRQQPDSAHSKRPAKHDCHICMMGSDGWTDGRMDIYIYICISIYIYMYTHGWINI